MSVPAAVSIFPAEIYQAPRSWTERAYHNLIYFNDVANARWQWQARGDSCRGGGDASPLSTAVQNHFVQGPLTSGVPDRPSPYAYHLAFKPPGCLTTGFERAVTATDLATVRATFAWQVGDQGAGFTWEMPMFGGRSGSLGVPLPTDLPATRTEYYSTQEGLRWDRRVAEGRVSLTSMQVSELATYEAGRTTTNAATSACSGRAYPTTGPGPCGTRTGCGSSCR